MASELGGVYAEISLHVGGVILTPAPASRYLPLEESAKGLIMSHFDRDAVEDLKLIKLDLLSVRGLAAISETKERLSLRSIPPDDAKTYKLLQTAQTIGCFQVESPAMMNLLRRMKPENIYELTQALALIRPGPTESGMKEALLRAPGEEAGLPGPAPRENPARDGGLLLYEEQVMQVAERVGRDAARGRRPAAAGPQEKKRHPGGAQGEILRRGARSGGTRRPRPRSSGRPWRNSPPTPSTRPTAPRMRPWPTRPSISRSITPCRTWRPCSTPGAGTIMLAEYIEEAKRRGIKFLGPDINRSGHLFEVEGPNIRVGLTSIKGLAVKTIEKIIEERRDVEFASVEDFLARVHLGKAELLSLIKAGVFDSLEPRRTRQILRYFQGIEDMEEVADMNPHEKAKMLVDSLGFSPEADSLELFEGKRPELRVRDLGNYAGQQVELVVRVVDARLKDTNERQQVFLSFRGRDRASRGGGGEAMPELRLAARLLPEGGGPPRRRRHGQNPQLLLSEGILRYSPRCRRSPSGQLSGLTSLGGRRYYYCHPQSKSSS